MPTIILTRLTCNQTEDNAGADEANLRIWADGAYQSLSRSMDNGDGWDLNVILTFEQRVKIQLYDLDNPGFPLYDDHDHLGTVTITPEQAAHPGNGTFNQDGADYEIEWIPDSRNIVRTITDARREIASLPKSPSPAAAIKVTKDGNFTVPASTMMELIEAVEQLDDEDAGTRGLFGSKHTYCCKMGHDNSPDQERQQFRSYSWQAPLFCIRMARGKGWSVGSVSRGECQEGGDDN